MLSIESSKVSYHCLTKKNKTNIDRNLIEKKVLPFVSVFVESSKVAIAEREKFQFDFDASILLGSDDDECETVPLFIPDVPDDESLLLLVDENDIRELSSPMIHKRKTFEPT